jgi:hypothetical protein
MLLVDAACDRGRSRFEKVPICHAVYSQTTSQRRSHTAKCSFPLSGFLCPTQLLFCYYCRATRSRAPVATVRDPPPGIPHTTLGRTPPQKCVHIGGTRLQRRIGNRAQPRPLTSGCSETGAVASSAAPLRALHLFGSTLAQRQERRAAGALDT